VSELKTSNDRVVPTFEGRLYSDSETHGLAGNWVRRAEVDTLLAEIERLKYDLQVQKGVVDMAYIPHRHLVEQRDRADHEFKNFHRLLCERFGYGHDERDWRRDQLSLIEYIAAQLPPETCAPQAPIARIIVRESGAAHYAPDLVDVKMYAAGLPPGDHDVYLDPTAPGLRQETNPCICPGGSPDGPLGWHNNCPLHGFEGRNKASDDQTAGGSES